MPRRTLALAAAGLLALTSGACAPNSGALPGADGAVAVVAAFYPLQFLAEGVGGQHAAVTNLAPPGAEPHDLELTPSQVAEISGADLVIYLSGFQPAVDAAVAEHAADRAFDVTSAVSLLDAAEDDQEEENHEGEEGEEEDDDHGTVDPHVWLDPDRMATIADELATVLGERDPDHADDYAAGAEALRADLAALDTELADGLADCQRREIVVSHDAFGYLADRYDLRQIAITGLTPEEEPSPQRLEDVINEAEAVGATTIFFEVLVSPAVADVIATEVGAQTAVLDPIEGLAPGSDEDYLSLMRQNLDALRGALGCP
jgi:zinc transport system substrate-binding protein